MPLNDSNFLTWYAAGESQFIPNLPRPFVFEPEVLSPVVWLVPGETIAYYVNSTDNSAPAGPVSITDERGNVYNPQQTQATINFPGGSHVYGTLTIPAGLGEGFVRLSLVTYVSQYLWVSTAANAAGNTAVVKFRNSDRLVNYRYRYLPTDFYQQFRVKLTMKSEDPETNKTVYRTDATGKTRPLYSEPRQLVTFQTPEYDRTAHRAITALLEHDTILINNQPYAWAGEYKTNSTEGDLLSTGEFILSDELYATLHRS